MIVYPIVKERVLFLFDKSLEGLFDILKLLELLTTQGMLYVAKQMLVIKWQLEGIRNVFGVKWKDE